MINISQEGTVKIGKFRNPSRLTLAVSEDVKAALKPVLSTPGTKFVFDLDNIDFIDSSGMGCLISLQNTAKQNNSQVRLCNIAPNNMKVFELLNLHKILDIQPSLEHALNNF